MKYAGEISREVLTDLVSRIQKQGRGVDPTVMIMEDPNIKAEKIAIVLSTKSLDALEKSFEEKKKILGLVPNEA